MKITAARLKKDTIQAHEGYKVFVCKDKTTGEPSKMRALYDGDVVIMYAERRPASDFVEESRENECFSFCETFTTVNGGRYVYWRDEELDRDYLTRITDGLFELL